MQSIQIAPICAGATSPSMRAVWNRVSKRWKAIWRTTVLIPSSIWPASRPLRSALVAFASRRSNTRPSPKIEAVSASVRGVSAKRVPSGAQSVWWTAWPSSWASVSTSRRSPM